MCILQPGEIYHIYNHAIGDDNLFREDGNYLYFLKRYADFIHPVAHTYAYCLMPNHFHVLVKIRSEEELKLDADEEDVNLEGFKNLPGLERHVIQQFSNLFNSYSKAYNKVYNRRGSLFIKNFKRKPVSRECDLPSVVSYIHRNAIHHGFCDTIEDWYWSSYHTYLNNKKTLLAKEETFAWFGGKEEFIRRHAFEKEKHFQFAEELD
jgi:REP element-mobilizing transposase RayT